MKLLILLQCCVLLCKLTAGHEGEGYLEGLGMENGKIADNQITASSEKSPYKAVNARLHYKNKKGKPLGWQPKKSRGYEWLQVDLLRDKYIVTGVATQGCRGSKRVFSVTKYKLGYSNDGKVFSTNPKLYEGNKDASTVKYHTLETPIKARYIRFQPKSWKNKICMRVELYGNITEACDSSPCLNGGTCIQDESGEEYICKCTSGWKGGNCELDFTGASCVDKSPSCGYWALIGECTENPGYMVTSCCVWCNHMKTLKNIATTSCTDENANCGVWANKGECCKNPAYMLEHCCAACKDKGYTVLP